MGTESVRYFNISPEVRKSLLKLYDLDKPGRLDEAIDLLAEWIKKQEHFIKKDIDREFLEKMIVTNKGSVEKSKKRLDKVYTMRTLVPDMFGTYCVKKHLKFSFVSEFPLPQLISDFIRIYLIKLTGDEDLDISLEMFSNWYKKAVYCLEYFRKYDYFASCILILDFTDTNVAKWFTKFIISQPQQIITFITEAYGVRVKGIHLVIKSNFAETLIPLIKKIVKEKLIQRLQIHKSMETVYNFVPKDYFSIEYGGKEKSMYELNNMWIDAISTKEFMDYIEIMNEAKTDETKRSEDNFNEEYLGIPGAFRSLAID